MKLAFAILLAYVATAIFYVWRDLSERNPTKVIGFVLNYRAGGGLINLLSAGIAWLPATILSAYWKPSITYMGRKGTALAFFLFAVGGIWLISN